MRHDSPARQWRERGVALPETREADRVLPIKVSCGAGASRSAGTAHASERSPPNTMLRTAHAMHRRREDAVGAALLRGGGLPRQAGQASIRASVRPAEASCRLGCLLCACVPQRASQTALARHALARHGLAGGRAAHQLGRQGGGQPIGPRCRSWGNAFSYQSPAVYQLGRQGGGQPMTPRCRSWGNASPYQSLAACPGFADILPSSTTPATCALPPLPSAGQCRVPTCRAPPRLPLSPVAAVPLGAGAVLVRRMPCNSLRPCRATGPVQGSCACPASAGGAGKL